MLAAAVAPAAAATPPPRPPLLGQSGTFAYVTNGLNGTVSVVDTEASQPSIVATIDLGDPNAAPNGVAVNTTSEHGTRVYVANVLADTMSLAVPGGVASVDIGDGEGPISVATSLDGELAYVTNSNSNGMSVVDVPTLSVGATVVVGHHPQEVAVTPDGDHAYIAIDESLVSGNVAVVDLRQNPPSLTTTIPVGVFPQGVAISPDGGRAYVTNFVDGTVSVIDTASNTVVATVTIGSLTSPVDVAVSPDGRRAYVVNFGARSVSVIDTTTNPPSVIATVPVGEEPKGAAVTPDGSQVYVTNSQDNTVSVIDTASNTVTHTIEGFDDPLGVAIGTTTTIGDAPTRMTLQVERQKGGAKGKDSSDTRRPSFTLKARLTENGESLEDRDVVFSTGSKALCIKSTDGRGRSTCTVRGGHEDRAGGDRTCFTATFGGDATYAAVTKTVCPGRRKERREPQGHS
ncbi:YncE family protein [Streptomyces sp. NPDC048191]|uniref:YncE family protein n=1 Tax=Streptomyces sp. NPDC048191 TaxID=3155484 RepID=UPI0033E58B4A